MKAGVIETLDRLLSAALCSRPNDKLELPAPVERRRIRRLAGVRLVDAATQANIHVEELYGWETGRLEPLGADRRTYRQLLDDLVAATVSYE